jgi:polysaccharide export outer membrane protein
MALLIAMSLAGCGGSSSTRADNFGAEGSRLQTSSAPGAAGARSGGAFSSASNASGGAYAIGPLDVLEITVFKVPDLSKTVEVSDIGTINLPLVGEVTAAGRTAQELERDLTAKLGAKYLQNPQVTVYVKDHKSQRVTIQGAVKSPGMFALSGRTTLLQGIAMAGGRDKVSDATVLILRQGGGRRQAAKFNVSAIESGQAEDPVLQTGDIVVAGTSAIKQNFQNVLGVLGVAGRFVLF